MTETFKRLLSFVNWTNPATETKSIWVGDQRASVLFFAQHRDPSLSLWAGSDGT
jgi:hypothetical protein